jgi:hypothetical protein
VSSLTDKRGDESLGRASVAELAGELEHYEREFNRVVSRIK